MSFGTLRPSCVLRALRNDSGGLSGTAVPKGDGACRVRRHGLSGLRAGALQEPSRPFSSPTRFASAFGLRQQELADLAGVQRATVSAALGNSKLQKFMRDARRVISAAMEVQPDRSHALYWFRNAPSPEFSHRTAEQLVSRGKVDAIISYLESTGSGSTG